jgi:GT2 family glycosyltransferase
MSKPFTAARARNAGFNELLGLRPAIEFTQFIDGDCELAPNWMRQAAAFLSDHPEVAVVCGRRRERYPDRSVYNLLCDMEWDTPVGEASQCGGDFLVRNTAFKEAGGFTEYLIAGEEPELCARLRAAGWKIWRLDVEMTRHDAGIFRFKQWWLRTVRSGYAYAEVSRLRGSDDGLWKRNVYRAMFWGGLLPVLILLSALLNPAGILLSWLYIAQILRMMLRGPHKGRRGLIQSTFTMLGKFAELLGIAKFYVCSIRGHKHPLIEYKL